AHVGDVALVTERGEYHGWTGGGCTRSSVLLEAMRAIAEGEPRLLSLSPEPEDGRRPGVVFLPMTCESGGTVEIYVEPVLPAAREATARIAGPAGLDLAARTHEEIAVSSMAQIVERRRPAQPASRKTAPAAGPREATDPVCGMSVTVAGARHTAEAHGVQYYF